MWAKCFLCVVVLVLAVSFGTVSADDGVVVHPGVSVDELDALLPETTAAWKRAMTHNDSIKWFAEQCSARTLQTTESGYLSKRVDPYGIVAYAGGSPYIWMHYPSSQYELADDFLHVNLSYDFFMGFGLYCVYTYPGADVRLTCWDEWTYFDCREDNNVIELAGGTVTPILVHETAGMSKGHYRVEMKCASEACDFGAVFAVRLNPILNPRPIQPEQWILGR